MVHPIGETAVKVWKFLDEKEGGHPESDEKRNEGRPQFNPAGHRLIGPRG